MAIALSVILSDSRQVDGRRWIQELHRDDRGVEYLRIYLVAAEFDANNALTIYASLLGEMLAQGEIFNNIMDVATNGSLAIPKFFYSTPAANISALRNNFASATQEQAVMIGDYLNSLTNAQLMAAFGMTNAQINTLRTNKLQPAATLASEIRAMTGT